MHPNFLFNFQIFLMKSVEIVGFKRANLGGKASQDLRNEANVPCVLYGKGVSVLFYAPMILFRELIYTPAAYTVRLNIEGDEYNAILQATQFHPVSDVLLHADFLLLHDDKKVKMTVPTRFIGISPGVQQGGKLVVKMKRITVKALPKDLPDDIEIDITGLALGKTFKIRDIKPQSYEIVNNPVLPVCSIDIPRALKGKQEATA